MSASVPRAAVAIATAVDRIMQSPSWRSAVCDDDKRYQMLVEAVCEELHPLGPVLVPSVHALREAVARDDRDEAIKRDFDGHNYRALARRHRLSTRQVRRIVDRSRPHHADG